MKKLLALVIAGGFLAALTGCPPATSPPAPPPPQKTTTADTKPSPTPSKPADTKPTGDKPTVTPPAVTKPVPPITKPATDKPNTDKPEPKTHSGKVVKVADGKLTMKGEDDKEHDHVIGKEAKITDADGKTIELKDLKEGAKIEVTTDDKGVTKVEVKK